MIFGLVGLVVRLLAGFCLLYALFVCAWLWLHFDAWVYALRNRDKKWKRLPAVRPPSDAGLIMTREIVFVRHGESTWNDTFNRSKIPIFFIPRLIKAAVAEVRLLLSGVQDSWFLDSPLSDLGFRQASNLRGFLAKTQSDFANVMNKRPGTRSVVVSSNLRRCVSTCMGAMWDRLQRENERVLLLSDLQEVSHNPDTLCITPAHTNPVPSWVDATCTTVPMARALANHIDATLHHGNKTEAINGLDRMLRFCSWVFAEDRGTTIVFGHSLYFRGFFREFLPESVDHIAKRSKIANAGAVGFTLQCFDGPAGPVYRIDESSIRAHYLGFKGK